MKYALPALLLSLFLQVAVHAALPPASPPIHQFRPDLEVYPQNFTIAMDDHARVYLGNADGVLIYDGEHWQHVPISNGEIVRSLAWSESRQRMYVGGYDAFGYLERSPAGTFEYHELSTLYQDFIGSSPFADIWHLLVDGDVVYFVALDHLFRFDAATGKAEAWLHERSLGPIARYDGRVYQQFRHEGIKVY